MQQNRWYSPGSNAFPLLVATAFILSITPLFWLFPIDIWVQSQFYSPDTQDRWPLSEAPFWKFLYQSAWIIGGIFAGAGILVGIAGSVFPKLQPWGLRGWCLLLVVVIGAGVIVNVILKDHYGRHRPSQIQEFGGNYPYLPPLVLGEQGVGKSFPSGHAAAGFAFYIFYFFLRHRNRRNALIALAAATALGLTFGVGRAVAGGHFISDTLWSGYCMFLASWLVYYPIMNMRRREERIDAGETEPPMSWKQKGGITAAVAAVIIGSLLWKPHTKSVSYAPSRDALANVPVAHLHLDFATANIAVDPKVETFSMYLQTKGFGTPNNKLESSLVKSETEWRYTYKHIGFFTEKGTNLELKVNPEWLERIDIQLDSGTLFLSEGLNAETVQLTGDGKLVAE